MTTENDSLKFRDGKHIRAARVIAGLTRDNKERKLVASLDNGKRVVLNKTNARYIAGHYGDDTNGWKNKEIELYVAPVDFQGRAVDGIRVRIPPRAPTAVATPSA
jgi:hypothetical protein